MTLQAHLVSDERKLHPDKENQYITERPVGPSVSERLGHENDKQLSHVCHRGSGADTCVFVVGRGVRGVWVFSIAALLEEECSPLDHEEALAEAEESKQTLGVHLGTQSEEPVAVMREVRNI